MLTLSLAIASPLIASGMGAPAWVTLALFLASVPVGAFLPLPRRGPQDTRGPRRPLDTMGRRRLLAAIPTGKWDVPSHFATRKGG